MPFRSVEIAHDAARGTIAAVELEDAAAQGAASEVLGRFALPFTMR